MSFRLTPQVVVALISDCLDEESTEHSHLIEIDGIRHKYSFNQKLVDENKDRIIQALYELPDAFQKNKGGGWSFLQACMDRHGDLWTGEHAIIDALFCLGVAAKKVTCMFPRDLWVSLPGEMPYYCIENE